MRRFVSLITVFAILIAPQIGIADTIDDLRLEGSSTVSRGTFIRSAIKVLDIDPPRTEVDLPYARVSRGMEPYVRVAHEHGALQIFGEDLRLAFPITRGEAVRVLYGLIDPKASSKKITFRDVRRGTINEKAAKTAVEKGWIEPVRENVFGFTRRLTGSHAEELLRNVSGTSIQQNGSAAPSSQPAETEEKAPVPVSVPNIQFKLKATPHTTLPRMDLFEAVWRLLNRDYLYQDKIDEQEAVYKALEALVASVDDPYTRFMRPKSAKNFQTQIKGQITGIGAQVEEKDGVVTIVTPLTSSPAQRAGLKPGDQILEVDGESLKDMIFMDAVEKIRGPKGSTVELTIRRNGGEMKISVTRDVVRVPEIEITWQNEIAVVKLMQFGRTTETELRDSMVKVQEQGPKGVILDVRNNPGGLLNAATIVISNFLPKGSEVAHIISPSGERTSVTDMEPTIAADIPLVVLVNDGSASASEIVAGALQDHKRAKVVGVKTFGKGTVQEVLQFNDNSNLKVTIAEWLTPKKRKIDGEGVEPDIRIEFTGERDEQMLKALEMLR